MEIKVVVSLSPEFQAVLEQLVSRVTVTELVSVAPAVTELKSEEPEPSTEPAATQSREEMLAAKRERERARRAAARAEKAAPVTEELAKEVEEEKAEPLKGYESETVDLVDIVNVLRQKTLSEADKTNVRKLLADYGVVRVSELPSEEYGSFYKALKAL